MKTLLAVLLALTTGCGSIVSERHIIAAQRAVDQAQVDDAAHKAPFAFGTAQTQLQQARVAYGYSRYAEAEALADRARDAAHQAQMAPAVKPGQCIGGP